MSVLNSQLEWGQLELTLPLEFAGEKGECVGCGVVAWCAVMAAVFACGRCGSSDAVMACVLRHQAHQHVAPRGHHTGPYNRPGGASVGQMCKGSGIKHVVHTLPSGLQRGRTVVSWSLAERHQSLHTRTWAQSPLLLVLALQWRHWC